MKRVEQRLLISLDVLLDTRLATLAKMNDGYPEMVLSKGWKERDGDFYEQWIDGFDRAQFEEFYSKRGETNDIHTKSLVSGYLSRLIADITIIRGSSVNHPMAGNIGIDINIWPYMFSGTEEQGLKDALKTYIGDGINIEIVRINPSKLSPKAIRGRWAVFSMYNFDEWFVIHSEALLETPIPSVVCIVPRLLKKPLTDDIETDPTLEVTGALVEFLGLEWITPKEVSIAI